MKFGKKIAQTATEYLIILAVVIIIALIVVGVLGGIPGIGGASASNVASAYWQTSLIGVDGIKISASSSAADSDSIILKNNQAVDIKIVEMSLGDVEILGRGDENYTILKGRTRAFVNTTGVPTTFSSADSVLTTGEFIVGGCTQGDSFSETLTVVYLDTNTDAEYEFVGEQNLEGECSA